MIVVCDFSYLFPVAPTQLVTCGHHAPPAPCPNPNEPPMPQPQPVHPKPVTPSKHERTEHAADGKARDREGQGDGGRSDIDAALVAVVAQAVDDGVLDVQHPLLVHLCVALLLFVPLCLKLVGCGISQSKIYTTPP